MSISSTALQGLTTSSWYPPPAPKGIGAGAQSSPPSSPPTTGSAGSGSSNPFQQLSQALQAVLLQVQSGGGGATGPGTTGAGTGSTGNGDRDGDGDTGPSPGAATTQGQHPRDRSPEMLETGAPDAAQTLAGTVSPGPARGAGSITGASFATGSLGLAALRAYQASTAGAAQQQTAGTLTG